MEKLFKLLSALSSSFFTLLKILFRSSLFLKKHKASGNEIFILGTGPSLANQYAEIGDKLISSITMSVNGFPLSDMFEQIKPNYFIVCSPGFYNDQAVDYNVDVRKKIISNLIKKTQWPLTFFIPAKSKKNKSFIQKIESNKNITLSYYNTTPAEGLSGINKFFFKTGLGSPRPHNVLIPSILQSINSGFKKLYLLGADHSWLPLLSVNQKNEVLLNQKHFYDADTSKSRQMHKNEGQGNRHLHEVLEKFQLSFKGYHELNAYAESQRAKIYNLTEGSFIDAFEKIDIAEL